MCDMTAKTVTRSVRFDEETNVQLEQLARDASRSVSEYIRWIVADVAARELRVIAHLRAMKLLAALPLPDDPDRQREEMWSLAGLLIDA
jgi:hypothetical protein